MELQNTWVAFQSPGCPSWPVTSFPDQRLTLQAMDVPSRQLADPSCQLAGPSRPLAGPSRQLAGLSRQLAGPSRQLAGLSDSLTNLPDPLFLFSVIKSYLMVG